VASGVSRRKELNKNLRVKIRIDARNGIPRYADSGKTVRTTAGRQVLVQLAELILEQYPDEKKEALEHLDFAIREFQDMKMQPSLERALKHKEILNA
jgi:hypothetical protein